MGWWILFWLLIGLLVAAGLFLLFRLAVWLLFKLGKWNRDGGAPGLPPIRFGPTSHFAHKAISSGA